MEGAMFSEYFCYSFAILLLLNSNFVNSTAPKLILISMDGFQHDYLDSISPDEADHFRFMIKNGVKAKSVMNYFPTVTYPNHYTIITGLYPESHGIVHNRFYDPVSKRYFHYDSREDNVDPFWYDVGAEPIYVTNKKADTSRNSGSVVWPAGIGKVKGIGPDRVIPKADSWSRINNTDRIDTLISWFADKTAPINLGLLYFLEPDETGHKKGGESESVLDLIKGELNNVLGYLFKRLKDVGLYEEMNIILTSDHGFANFSRDKAVMLNDHLNSSWYKTDAVEFGSYSISKNIFPEEGQTEKVMQALMNIPNLKVYKKGETELERLHYSSSERIAPMVITGAKEGVVMFSDAASRDKMPSIGVHGYDPNLVPNMRPFFIAMGPAFKKGYVSEQIDLVDIYPLMCRILGIEPAPNNGSFDHVKAMLLETDNTNSAHNNPMSSYGIFVGLCVILAWTV